MPYKVYHENGKYCLHKHEGGVKGALVKGSCHASKSKTERMARAIYAHEGKKGLDIFEEFALFQEEEAESDTDMLQKVKDFVNGLIAKKEKPATDGDRTGFLLFKDQDERLRFLVRYSNKWRDNDYPVSEIISDNSHRRFDEMVNKGILPMPELWLWHVPEWKLGVADWHAYDDSGFTLASGLVDQGKEELALLVSKQKGVRTSHGMPPSSIVRDPEDPTVIIEHQTVEISVLPGDRAANKMTGFYILDRESKEAGMAIANDKLKKLAEKWSPADKLLKELESINALDAKEADELGIESKEVGDPEEVQPEAEPVETETPAEVVETEVAEVEVEPEEKAEEESLEVEDAEIASKATGDSPTREEIAEAVVDAVRPIIEENRKLTDEVAQLRKEVTHLKESDEQKIEKAISETPPASLGALIAGRLSVTHSKETEIDGRTALAKSKPKETDTVRNVTGVPFLDKMLSSDSVS